MSANLHSNRKSLISVFLLIVLTAELTIFGATVSAQNRIGPASAPSPNLTGDAMSSGVYGTPTQPSPPMGPSHANQAPPNASLLGVPVYGTAPLTVDFYVGIANPHGPLAYQWNFGDGVAASLPTGAYVLHVYQHPGTYFCSLTLSTALGSSATLFTTIVVRPRQSLGNFSDDGVQRNHRHPF